METRTEMTAEGRTGYVPSLREQGAPRRRNEVDGTSLAEKVETPPRSRWLGYSSVQRRGRFAMEQFYQGRQAMASLEALTIGGGGEASGLFGDLDAHRIGKKGKKSVAILLPTRVVAQTPWTPHSCLGAHRTLQAQLNERPFLAKQLDQSKISTATFRVESRP